MDKGDSFYVVGLVIGSLLAIPISYLILWIAGVL